MNTETLTLIALIVNTIALFIVIYQTHLSKKSLGITQKSVDDARKQRQIEMLSKFQWVIQVHTRLECWLKDLSDRKAKIEIMKSCIFCKIYNSGEEKAGETEYFYMRFDKYPVSPGHMEVIVKRHVESVFDLNQKEWNSLKSAIDMAVEIIEDTDFKKMYKAYAQDPLDEKSRSFCTQMLEHEYITKKPDAYNIGINEGTAAGRTIDHLHIHIIPRFSGDIENPTGGIRNIIPGMGNYKE